MWVAPSFAGSRHSGFFFFFSPRPRLGRKGRGGGSLLFSVHGHWCKSFCSRIQKSSPWHPTSLGQCCIPSAKYPLPDWIRQNARRIGPSLHLGLVRTVSVSLHRGRLINHAEDSRFFAHNLNLLPARGGDQDQVIDLTRMKFVKETLALAGVSENISQYY